MEPEPLILPWFYWPNKSYPYQTGFYSNQVANIDQNTDKSFFEFWILNQFLHIKYEDVFAKKMELLAKIVSNYQPLTIFAKKLHLDVWQGCEYVSVILVRTPEITMILNWNLTWRENIIRKVQRPQKLWQWYHIEYVWSDVRFSFFNEFGALYSNTFILKLKTAGKCRKDFLSFSWRNTHVFSQHKYRKFVGVSKSVWI